MAKWSFFKKKSNVEERNSVFDYLTYNNTGSYTQSKSLLLSTVYRCVEVISDSVAQLPIECYKSDSNGYKVKLTEHPTYHILNKEPNSRMTRFTFIKTLITSAILRGNGFALIERDSKGDVIALHYLPNDYVQIEVPPNSVFDKVRYNVRTIGRVEAKDMIHILNFSYDGIKGISTLQHAAHTLGLSMDAEANAAGFFKGGGNLAGVLKVNSTLSKKQKEDLKSAWNMAFDANVGNPNGVAVLEGNMEYQPITVNPSDAQLLETRQFNVIDICRFFGVSPVKCFDLSKSSYSTVEATELAFLTDTLAPLLEKIELEFERKIFKKEDNIDVRFNTSTLLRADKQSLASYYNTLFNIGVVSVNDIRKELDLNCVDGGDNHFVQVNLTTLQTAANNLPTDNKLTNIEENETNKQ